MKHTYHIDKVSKIPEEIFKEYVQTSKYWNELIEKCGYKHPGYGGAYHPRKKQLVLDRIKQLGLPYNHLKRIYREHKRLSVRQLKNKRRTTNQLRRMLHEAGRLYICEWCRCEHMTLWNGEWLWRDWPVTLQIDHINGRNGNDEDDRLDNLRYLCPMCHSQTNNYTGKSNRGKKYRTQKTS